MRLGLQNYRLKQHKRIPTLNVDFVVNCADENTFSLCLWKRQDPQFTISFNHRNQPRNSTKNYNQKKKSVCIQSPYVKSIKLENRFSFSYMAFSVIFRIVFHVFDGSQFSIFFNVCYPIYIYIYMSIFVLVMFKQCFQLD